MLRFIFTLIFIQCTICHAVRFTFDLSPYDPNRPMTNTFRQYADLNNETAIIEISGAPKSVGFYIIQVHSYLHNVTLSYTDDLETQTFVNGSNIGLVSQGIQDQTFYVFPQNDTRALLVVTVYEASDPIPGGCNLSFETQIAPFQLVSLTDDMIVVQSQPPSIDGIICEKSNVQVEMYHMYLPENIYGREYYFSAVEMMLTPDLIKQNGRQVTTDGGFFRYRKLYSAYRGIGQVFGIVASVGNRTSAYVPAVSYGCELDNIEANCYGPVSDHWKILVAALCLFGIFTCFFGHTFFLTTLFFIGFTIGIFFTYTSLSAFLDLSVVEKNSISIPIGALFAAIWLVIWWKYGIPIISVAATYFLGAFLLVCAIFYSPMADFKIFHNDIAYWGINVSLSAALTMIFVMFTHLSHIFVLSLLGSYSCIVALNYYAGGNLQYIFINAYRRMVVTNFNMATIDPPYQIRDVCHTILMIIMMFFGYYYQKKQQRGRPPFPPRVNQRGPFDERTPLLA